MKACVLLALALALVGCASREDSAARIARYCQSLGAKPGTDAYVNCRVNTANAEMQANATIRAGVLASP